MKKKIIIMFVLTLMMFSTVLSATGINKVNETPQNDLLYLQINGITFNQVDYTWTNYETINSDTGEIIVEIDKISKATGLKSGYVNVHSAYGWVIENLPFTDDFPYPDISTFFHLGGSGDVTSIDVYIDVTEEPYQRFPSGPLTTYPVYNTEFNAGGADRLNEIERPTPPTPNIPGPGLFVDGEYNFMLNQSGHPNVPTAINQCVPAAYANNIQYLENVFGVYVPYEHIFGINGTPSDSLVAHFDLKMQRKSINFTNGSGTTNSNGLQGFIEYAWFDTPFIDVRHQGVEGEKDVHFEINGNIEFTSYGQGETITFDYILNEFQKGNAVTMLWWRYYANGSGAGGHMVQLVGIGKTLGVPYMIYLDDHQGDYTSNLITKQSYLSDPDNDGILNVNGVYTPPGGETEVAKIVIMEAWNQPPHKPSIPSGGGIILKPDVEYEFTTSTTDPNGAGQQLWYFFDWGDGTNSGWVGPYLSGEIASAKVTWDSMNLYSIRVKARDIHEAESSWSDIRYGIVPYSYNSITNHPILYNIFSKLFEK